MGRLLAPAALAAVLLCLALRPEADGVPLQTSAAAPEGPPESVAEGGEPSSPRGIVSAARVRNLFRRSPEPDDEPSLPDSYAGPLRFLLRAQNADGSWGDLVLACPGHLVGRVGITSLALYSFLTQGYSHLSKDTYDGVCVGDAVKSAYGFLLRGLEPDGRFGAPVDPIEQAMGALALAEAYGLTGSRLLQEPAQRALDGLCSLQRPDGSWGTDVHTDWAAQALESAKVADLRNDPDGLERLRFHYEHREARGFDVGAAYFRRFVLKDEGPWIRAATEWIAGQPPEADPDRFSSVYARSALLRVGGEAQTWNEWSGAQKTAFRATQSADGSWSAATPGQAALRNALGLIARSLFYRYTNVYGSR
jgi:hypothetical protein